MIGWTITKTTFSFCILWPQVHSGRTHPGSRRNNIKWISCGSKFLREFYFADRRFVLWKVIFCDCKMTDLFLIFWFFWFSPIFAIFQKSGLFEIQHFCRFSLLNYTVLSYSITITSCVDDSTFSSYTCCSVSPWSSSFYLKRWFK